MRATVEGFLDHLAQEQGASAHTVAAYSNDLEQFLSQLTARNVTSWRQVTREHVADFLHWLEEHQYALSTVARKVAAVRSFFHFLITRGVLDDDPSSAIPPPRVPRRPPRVLSADDVSRLLAAPGGGATPKFLRDWALLELLYATGMRASEMIALTVPEVDLERGVVHCGDEPERVRLLPLTERAVAALRTYLERGRPRLVQGEEDPAALFVNHRGRPLTRQGLWLIVKERAAAVGIEEGATPHALRHSYATHMLEQGVSLQELQQSLGHANLATTQVYVRADDLETV